MDTQPATRTPLMRRWELWAAVLAVAALIAVVVLVFVGRSSDEESAAQWGMSPADAARKYTSCENPTVRGNVADCSGYVVMPSGSETEQQYLVAMLMDQGDRCWVVFPGVVVVVQSERQVSLTAAFKQDPQEWANDHDGVFDCS